MPKILTCLFLCFIGLSATAQEIRSGSFHFGNPSTGSHRIFADQCNVRSKPDAAGDVLGKLFIGNAAEVLEITGYTFTQNGLTAPWVLLKSGNLKGYVWAGNITAEGIPLSKTETALWGIIAVKKSAEKEQYFAAVRVVKNQSILYQKEFEVLYADRPMEANLAMIPKVELDSVRCVLILETLSEACGVFASEHHLLLTSSGLFFVGSGWSMGDGGVLHTTRSYYYPIDSDNPDFSYKMKYIQSNTLERIIEHGEYIDECEYETNSRRTRFNWDGVNLEKVCD